MTDETRDTYRFEADADLSESIREAVAEERDVDAAAVDVDLYDDVDPDALDALIRKDARPETSVELHTNAVKVKLWGDGSTNVQVLDEDADA